MSRSTDDAAGASMLGESLSETWMRDLKRQVHRLATLDDTPAARRPASPSTYTRLLRTAYGAIPNVNASSSGAENSDAVRGEPARDGLAQAHDWTTPPYAAADTPEVRRRLDRLGSLYSGDGGGGGAGAGAGAVASPRTRAEALAARPLLPSAASSTPARAAAASAMRRIPPSPLPPNTFVGSSSALASALASADTQRALGERDAEIARLRGELNLRLDDSSRVNVLLQELRGRDAELAGIHASYARSMQAKDSEVARLTGIGEALNAELQKKVDMLSRLGASNAEQTRLCATLQAALRDAERDRDGAVHQLRLVRAASGDGLEHVRAERALLERENEDLRAKLRAQAEETTRGTRQLAEQEQAIRLLRERVTSLRAEVERHATLTGAMQQQQQQQQQQPQPSAASLAALQEALAAAQATVRQQQNEIGTLTDLADALRVDLAHTQGALQASKAAAAAAPASAPASATGNAAASDAPNSPWRGGGASAAEIEALSRQLSLLRNELSAVRGREREATERVRAQADELQRHAAYVKELEAFQDECVAENERLRAEAAQSLASVQSELSTAQAALALGAAKQAQQQQAAASSASSDSAEAERLAREVLAMENETRSLASMVRARQAGRSVDPSVLLSAGGGSSRGVRPLPYAEQVSRLRSALDELKMAFTAEYADTVGQQCAQQ